MENSMHPMTEMILFAAWVPAMIVGSWLIAKLLKGGFKTTCVLGAALMLFLAGYLGLNPNGEKQASDDLLIAFCVTALVLLTAAIAKLLIENTKRNPQPQPLPANVKYPRPRDQR